MISWWPRIWHCGIKLWWYRLWAEKVLALTTAPLASALTLEYRECCRSLADPTIANPLWWLGYRCAIETLVARLAEKGIAVTLPSPATRRDR